MAGAKKSSAPKIAGKERPSRSSATTPDQALSRVRGSLPIMPANARGVAALTSNPGCARRRLIDASGVPAHILADRAGFPSTRGQSPFAIAAGHAFEERLKKRTNYTLLAEALAPFVDLPLTGLQVEDLNDVGHIPNPDKWKEARVKRTSEVLAKLARGDADAPQLVDHPMLMLNLIGSRVYLEPDALAYRSGGQLELVEIKSYPIIDHQADPAKVASTAGQSAVYVLALRETLAGLGFDPDLIKWSVILVAPRNFGRVPTAHRIPLKKKAQSIQRVLSRVSPINEVLNAIPATLTFDVDPGGKKRPQQVARATSLALEQVPARYVPDCLTTCDMGAFCRDEAIRCDSPSRLGRDARDTLGAVETLGEALALADMDASRVPDGLEDVADALSAARAALDQARSSLPPECGISTKRPRRKKT